MENQRPEMGNNNFQVHGGTMDVQNLYLDTIYEGEIQYTDKNGGPAKVDGEPQYSSSAPSIIQVTGLGLSEDGTKASFSVTFGGNEGTAEVSATADVDRGGGVEPLVLTGTVSVLAGKATGGTFNFKPVTT